jgi:ketosteroid isomerase-like protein
MINIRPVALCIVAAPMLGGCSGEASAQQASPEQPVASAEAAPSWPPSEDAVRANIRAAFERLEAGAHEEHVRGNFAPDATFVIHGDPELAGNYSGHEAIIAGLDNLFQLVPDHDFTLHEMWVTIGSSEVTAAVAWSDAAQLPSGQPLPTQGMNRLRVGPGGLLEEHLFIAPDGGWPDSM